MGASRHANVRAMPSRCFGWLLYCLTRGRKADIVGLVRKKGLEPPRRKALEPKSSASTNSATFA